MKYKHIATLCAVCCLSFSNYLKAQELVSTTGGFSSDANASLGWSVGQIVIETLPASNYILTQGFHQSTVMVTSVDKPFSNLYPINVYPNPTDSELIITSEFPGTNTSEYTVLLYDMQGQILLRRTGPLGVIALNMKELASSIYLLKVVGPDNHQIQTFQIIKQ